MFSNLQCCLTPPIFRDKNFYAEDVCTSPPPPNFPPGLRPCRRRRTPETPQGGTAAVGCRNDAFSWMFDKREHYNLLCHSV